ncbi:MAG TPA: sigma 54-interacting transcriptional regulator [Polyangia bacterium]|nr:sigma 54-interacting transcriptional regulator [Polyangia bacterium]
MSDPQQTLSLEGNAKLPPGAVRRFRLTIVEGPKAGLSWESSSDRCSIGFHPSNDLVVEDATVSRFHCEVRIGEDGAHVRDLDSRNGTVLDGVRVSDAHLRGGSLLKMGRVGLRFEFSSESNRLPVSVGNTFGNLVGTSVAIRTAFALLERAAASDVTVLLEGETGTGKGVAAEAIHKASTRRDKPFLVVDCGAIPPNLLESELFGHEKGSFTGAVSRRVGAFEEASGGTIFLDEIGELAQDLQPKLLRVLESKEFRRVGGNAMNKTDVRVVAATNRDLRNEVNAGRFRSDLYFRLAVVKTSIPPLRERPEDIPITVDQILRTLGAEPAQTQPLRTPDFFAALAHSAWPGNVRELRNYLERCLVFQEALPVSTESPANPASMPGVDPKLAYAEARRRALDGFERGYAEALLREHGGKVAQAAAAAGMDRVYLYRILRRHGIKPSG